jgi:hypothetical protein
MLKLNFIMLFHNEVAHDLYRSRVKFKIIQFLGHECRTERTRNVCQISKKKILLGDQEVYWSGTLSVRHGRLLCQNLSSHLDCTSPSSCDQQVGV